MKYFDFKEFEVIGPTRSKSSRPSGLSDLPRLCLANLGQQERVILPLAQLEHSRGCVMEIFIESLIDLVIQLPGCPSG